MDPQAIQDYFSQHPVLAAFAAVAAVSIICLFSFVIARHVLLRAVKFFVRHSPTKWDDALLKHGVFSRLAWMAPGLVVYYAVLWFPENVVGIVQRLVLAYMALVLIGVVNRTLAAAETIFQTSNNDGIPVKGYIQLGQLVVYIVGAIFVFSTIVGQSPWGIFTGLGAMSAVLMLVFKDTILSFVASIQIATTGMVKVGDWISMPQYGADGDVVDISLPRVLVQNWDKTITYIPTHKFLDEAFTNWRGMSESGGRRIKRALQIDQNSVRFMSEADLGRLSQITLLKSYIEEKKEALREINDGVDLDGSVINSRRLTNLGCLRAYMIRYLEENPKIHKDMTFLVRQLPPSATGVPLEIYVFSNDIAWAAYEAIQADIFDHLLAALPQFDLRIFQNPTGKDFEGLADQTPQPTAS